MAMEGLHDGDGVPEALATAYERPPISTAGEAPSTTAYERPPFRRPGRPLHDGVRESPGGPAAQRP
jgi:hypothetical protein